MPGPQQFHKASAPQQPTEKWRYRKLCSGVKNRICTSVLATRPCMTLNFSAEEQGDTCHSNHGIRQVTMAGQAQKLQQLAFIGKDRSWNAADHFAICKEASCRKVSVSLRPSTSLHGSGHARAVALKTLLCPKNVVQEQTSQKNTSTLSESNLVLNSLP